MSVEELWAAMDECRRRILEELGIAPSWPAEAVAEVGGEPEKLYLTVPEAAQYAGFGERTMRDYVNSADPPPYIEVGNRRLIQRAALPAYLESRQPVRL